MKLKKPAKSNEKQDMSREEKFDLWIKDIDREYGRHTSFSSLFNRCIDTGRRLGLLKKCDYVEMGLFLYEKWRPISSNYFINEMLMVFAFSIKHNISKLETINFDLLYKNKQRFGNWETALLITNAVLEDETLITK